MDTSIRWGRIVVAAILLEIAITALVLPFGMMYGNPLDPQPDRMNMTPYLVSAAVGCAGFGFVFGRWVARRAGSRVALHGLLVGVVATLLYFGLCSLAPGGLRGVIAAYSPALYATFNVLRILGAWAGGALAKPA